MNRISFLTRGYAFKGLLAVTIQVFYFTVLTDKNLLGRHLELWKLPKGDKVASSGFLFLMVLAIIISQNIFYKQQIQVHPRICQTIDS